MKNLLPLLALLLFVSCATRATTDADATTTDETQTTMPDREDEIRDTDMDDTDMDGVDEVNPQLQSTEEALGSVGGDITALPPSAAVDNIDGWIGQLTGMAGTDNIVRDLNMLKDELGAPSIDGAKVSQLLSSLATETRTLESEAPGLSLLATSLDAGAQKLAE